MKDSKGTYIAKIVGALDSSPVTIAAAGAAESSFQNVVDELKVGLDILPRYCMQNA